MLRHAYRYTRFPFQAANKKKSKGREEEALDQEEFIAFYYSLLKRPELEGVFRKYAGKDGRMSAQDLVK